MTTTSCRPMRENIWNLTLSLEYIFVARVRNFKYERANLRLRNRSFYILYSIIQFTCTLTYLLWFFIWSNRGVHPAQTIGKPRNEFWSSLFLEICKGKIKLTLLLPIWKIIPCEVLHLSSKSLVVSYQVHGKNISRHKRKNELVILPQYLISHRVSPVAKADFSQPGLCLSLQCKMLVLLLGLMWNSSHLNATVSKDYGLEAIYQSSQVVTQQFNDRLTNYKIGELRRKRKSKLKVLGQHNSYGSFGAWE